MHTSPSSGCCVYNTLCTTQVDVHTPPPPPVVNSECCSSNIVHTMLCPGGCVNPSNGEQWKLYTKQCQKSGSPILLTRLCFTTMFEGGLPEVGFSCIIIMLRLNWVKWFLPPRRPDTFAIAVHFRPVKFRQNIVCE